MTYSCQDEIASSTSAMSRNPSSPYITFHPSCISCHPPSSTIRLPSTLLYHQTTIHSPPPSTFLHHQTTITSSTIHPPPPSHYHLPSFTIRPPPSTHLHHQTVHPSLPSPLILHHPPPPTIHHPSYVLHIPQPSCNIYHPLALILYLVPPSFTTVITTSSPKYVPAPKTHLV